MPDQKIPTNHELAIGLTTLEERMNTHQSDYKAIVQTLRADIERRDTEAARRETRMLIALIAVVGIATAILGLMIQLA